MIEEWQLKSVIGKSAKKNDPGQGGLGAKKSRPPASPPVLSAVGGSRLFGRQRRPMLYLPTYLAPFINCLRSSFLPCSHNIRQGDGTLPNPKDNLGT